MSYESILKNTLEEGASPCVLPEVKFIEDGNGIKYPVLFCSIREKRPFRKYSPLSREDCPLCKRVMEGSTSSAVVKGMEWLPATWPIKSYHAIIYPKEHRASILVKDLYNLGMFVDLAGDAVACVNMRGSAASIPEHFHAQLHEDSLTETIGGSSSTKAFALLSCEPELIASSDRLTLARFPVYPAFVLLLQGAWEMLGLWLITYFAASNTRPHNFALASGGRLFIIPRGLEKPPSQENKYGASEILGLITPVTRKAYDSIDNSDIIAEALRLCSIEEPKERLAVEEHAIWTMNHIQKVAKKSNAKA